MDAKLNIDLHIPFSSNSPIVKVGGSVGFWDESKSGLWQAEGNVYLKLWEISAEVAGLVNNNYIAGCLALDGFGVQGRYRFADSSIGGGFFGFSNCSDQLKEYKQKPLVKHSGGFVGGESLRLPPVGTGRNPAGGGPLGAGATPERHRLTGGRGRRHLHPARRASSRRSCASPRAPGRPVVTLIAPGGQTYTTPVAPGHIATSGQQFIAAIAPDHNQVLVLLKHPAGWHLARADSTRVAAALQAGSGRRHAAGERPREGQARTRPQLVAGLQDRQLRARHGRRVRGTRS